jgi:AcrR family transcriptional regulator
VTVRSIRDARREMYRRQIVAAAEAEFARSGFDKTKVADIAQSADVSLATLYKNFAGKDEIWDELNQQRMDEFIADGKQALIGVDSPLDRLLSVLRALVVYFGDHPNYLQLHISEGLSWATAGTEWGRGNQRDAWRTGIEIMVALAEDTVGSGEVQAIRPPVLAGLVVSALQVWLTDWLTSGFDRPAEQVADELTQYLSGALSVPPSPSAKRRASGTAKP